MGFGWEPGCSTDLRPGSPLPPFCVPVGYSLSPGGLRVPSPLSPSSVGGVHRLGGCPVLGGPGKGFQRASVNAAARGVATSVGSVMTVLDLRGGLVYRPACARAPMTSLLTVHPPGCVSHHPLLKREGNSKVTLIYTCDGNELNRTTMGLKRPCIHDVDFSCALIHVLTSCIGHFCM